MIVLEMLLLFLDQLELMWLVFKLNFMEFINRWVALVSIYVLKLVYFK